MALKRGPRGKVTALLEGVSLPPSYHRNMLICSICHRHAHTKDKGRRSFLARFRPPKTTCNARRLARRTGACIHLIDEKHDSNPYVHPNPSHLTFLFSILVSFSIWAPHLLFYHLSADTHELTFSNTPDSHASNTHRAL